MIAKYLPYGTSKATTTYESLDAEPVAKPSTPIYPYSAQKTSTQPDSHPVSESAFNRIGCAA